MPRPFTNDTITGDIFHQWTVPSYERHERGPAWYMIAIVLGLIFIVYSIIAQIFLFALVVVLVGIILYLQANQEPPSIDVAITELGVIIGDRMYRYDEFERFYLVYRPPEVKTLYLDTKKMLRPNIPLSLDDENPLAIRDTLRQYIPEDTEKEDEPISDMLARRLKIH